jgi:hypothetical protein
MNETVAKGCVTQEIAVGQLLLLLAYMFFAMSSLTLSSVACIFLLTQLA